MSRGNATGAVLALLATAAGALGCSSDAPTRAQIVLVIDTDLAPSGELIHRPELPLDGTTDTLRVDALDEQGRVYDSRELVVPELRDWPVSLAVAVNASTPSARLRLRAFRAAMANHGEVLGHEAWEPLRELTIDRLVTVTAPEEGIRRIEVVLRGDCLGTPAAFVGQWTTCISSERLRGSPDEGQLEVAGDAPLATLSGTWQPLQAKPCAGAGPDGAVCVPGGFSILGDRQVSGWSDGINFEDAVPLRPVVLSPFWMDATEVTVGQYRALSSAGQLQAEPPQSWADTQYLRDCTWHGNDTPDFDDLPLNCLQHQAAAEVCTRRSGTLPSEAQWEHEARGRGQRRSFPWGNELPQCCSANVYRFGSASSCPGRGPSPVPLPGATTSCAVGPDVSRDGVLDLAGNLMEYTRDSLLPFDHPCWADRAILYDPLCEDEAVTALRVARGGDWASPPETAFAALRRGTAHTGTASTGFQCVYPAVAP